MLEKYNGITVKVFGLILLVVIMVAFWSPVHAQAIIQDYDGLDVELETSIKPKTSTILVASCPAVVTQKYQQRNTLARVNTIIENNSCVSGMGTFDIVIRVRNEDGGGGTQSFEFSKVWEQVDNQEVSFTENYPIGENVKLLGVRTMRIRCDCTEPVAE